MAKKRRKRKPFSWKKVLTKLTITLSTIAVLVIVVPIGVSYAAPGRIARSGYDMKGNNTPGFKGWLDRVSAHWQDGTHTIIGHFTQFGNHFNESGWGRNADTLDKWYKQKGKLSEMQIHGGNDDGSKIERIGLYGYAKSIGIDPNAYKSNASLLKAVRNYVHKKSRATDAAGEENKRMWGSFGREKQNQKKVWQHYTSGLIKAKGDLSKSAAAKVDAYLKKHGGTKGSDKWYKALDTALHKYATGKAKKELGETEKKRKKEQDNVGEGEKKTTADDVKKMLEKGEMPEPTTLWGKIGRALMNAFWSSSIGNWLEGNGAAATIFAGAKSPDELATEIQSSPKNLIYPAKSSYSTMEQVSNWLQPAMIALGGALITLALVVSTMKMGYGQGFGDPARYRVAWYHNIIDTIIAVVGVAAFPSFVTMILQLDGDILLGFANFMSSLQPGTSSESVFATAIKLGFDKTTVNAISTGMLLGGNDFSGVIFEIIYLLAYVGLAVYIKYFYFVRAITFTVLVGIGPVFVALWSFDIGKQRTVAWLRDFIGTVFIQVIHSLTILFMALFMDWSNSRIVGQTADQIANMINWQKANPGKQFLNAITLGFANQTPNGNNAGSVFEVLVTGFIIMILFRPLSKSLAELFGISTNMLDNIHQSTSRTLKAGAMIGGAALGAAALGLGGAALSTGKGVFGAAGSALKQAGKGAKSFKDFRKNLKKGFGKNFKSSLRKRKPFRKALAQANGIVGPNAGRIMGAAVGAGAGDPMAMMALSAAGGAIGDRAARLANVPLKSLGLGQVRKLGKSITKNPDMSKFTNDKVNAANAKTKKGLESEAKSIRDANNGHEAVDPNMANFQKQRNAVNDALASGKIDKAAANKQLSEIAQSEANYKNIAEDADAQNMIAVADARKQASGNFSNAAQLSKAANEALGSEKSKLAGESGQADKVQQSLALSGAATNGAVMSRLNSSALDKAAQNAKNSYAKEHAGEYAKNGFASKQAWMDSSQYRQGEAAATNVARKEAAMQSNGTVFSMPDQAENASFGGSMVNKDTFKNEMAQSMQDAGVTQATQNKVLAAIDGVQGKALVEETPIEGANSSLQTINYGLSNQLGKQAAFSINNSGNAATNATPVSAYDLAQVYKGDNNPNTLIGGSADADFTANGFKDYMASSENAMRFQNVQSGLASAYADWQHDKAAVNNGFDMATSGDAFGGPMGGGFGGLFGGSAPRRSPSGFGGMTPNDYIAEQRIGDFYSTLGPSGMSPQEAIDQLSAMAPSTPSNDLHGQGGSGIAPGDLQLVTTNEASYVRAKMGDGDYQLVGNYGAGDPALQGSENIIQNLDVSPDGTIGPRYDSSTHRMEDPYSEIGNLKVPRAYTNGGPDLSSMLGGFASPEESNAVDMSDYNTMGQASELHRAVEDQSTMTLDKLNGNYSDFSYYSDGDKGVIVGRDDRDGVYKQVSPVVEDSILGTHATGQQYRIPLYDSGNGLVPDTLGAPEIFSKNPMSPQDKKQMLDTLRTKMDSSSERQEFNGYLNDILNPTTRNLHNFIAKRPASQNISGLDFAGK